MKLVAVKSLITLVVIAFTAQLSLAANTGCIRTLKSRTGTVYAGGPASTSLTPTTNTVTVKVSKTDGRAQTIVNIYVGNQRKAFIEFNNGNYTTTKTKTVSGVRNKTVRVEIVNQSVGNKFTYNLKVTGQMSNNLGTKSGNLVGQGQATKGFTKPCKNRITITFTRTSGQARANIFIKRNGRRIAEEILTNNENRFTKTYSNAAGATYEIIVKNISVGNRIGYTVSGVQKD